MLGFFITPFSNIIKKTHPLYQFHSEKPLIAIRYQLIESYQIRVGNIGEGPKFLFEAVEVFRIGVVQRLERDDRTAFSIVDLINDTEASRTESPLD